MKIACFGFSANPPHLSHFNAVKEILKKFLADEVWLIPCWQHGFGKKFEKWEHRWNMVKLMESVKIKCSDIEFQRKGISSTICTVRALKKIYPQHEFVWVVGSDIVKDQSYKKWNNWDNLAKEIEFWVTQRQGFNVFAKSLPNCFSILPIKTLNISSTLIRDRVKKGLSIKGLVTPEVEKYILKNKLYCD